ncbi:chorismate mutase, partial [Vibrio parahaemolyticus V-223/04]
HKFQPKRR